MRRIDICIGHCAEAFITGIRTCAICSICQAQFDWHIIDPESEGATLTDDANHIPFAELLLDGVLSASLYRRLRGLETRHWLETALRRTALPFFLTAIIVSASGWAMTLYAPEAQSIGEVITHAKQAG